MLRQDLAPWRDELIISTKAGYWMWHGPYGEWGSRKYLLASLDQSLRRMGLEYVDIFYSHRPDPDTPLEETMGALDHAVRSGKALYVGISNYNADADGACSANSARPRHALPDSPATIQHARSLGGATVVAHARADGHGQHCVSRPSRRAASPTATSVASRGFACGARRARSFKPKTSPRLPRAGAGAKRNRACPRSDPRATRACVGAATSGGDERVDRREQGDASRRLCRRARNLDVLRRRTRPHRPDPARVAGPRGTRTRVRKAPVKTAGIAPRHCGEKLPDRSQAGRLCKFLTTDALTSR